MKTLDKLMMTIVGLLCFCVSAAALIFMDFSTEHEIGRASCRERV